MSYSIQLTIPKSSHHFKLYIYRSTNAGNINTIEKVKSMQPIMIVDEDSFDGETIVVTDGSIAQAGVTYFGPEPNSIPVTEYNPILELKEMKTIHSYCPVLTLEPFDIKQHLVYYYSIMGVAGSQITHISKVNSVVLESDYKQNGIREIQTCDNYTGSDEDFFSVLALADWSTNIVIGNMDDPIAYSTFKHPFVSTVPIFSSDDISFNNKAINTLKTQTLMLPNIWQIGNLIYNKRKLKSFRVRNIYDGKYSAYSEPTFQSELEIPVDRMLIFRKEITTLAEGSVTIPTTELDALLLSIIRKDGSFYSASFRFYAVNESMIDTTSQDVAIVSDSSAFDKFLIKSHALPNHSYLYTIYLQDQYGYYSQPLNIISRT